MSKEPTKDQQFLYDMYNGTSTDDGKGDLETYENWLERQLIYRCKRLGEYGGNDEVVTIYKFQLDEISDALRITSNIHKCAKKETCHDRTVTRAWGYAKNALEGKKDEHVGYM